MSIAHTVNTTESGDSDYIDYVTLKLEMINIVAQQRSNQIHAEMFIKGQPIRFHVDRGASVPVNVLPSHYVQDQTTSILQMWNKSEVKPAGTCQVCVINPVNNRKYSVEFTVVKENLTPLLGAKACGHMQLLKILWDNFKNVPQHRHREPNSANHSRRAIF